MPLLEIADLSVNFGGLQALSGINLSIEKNSFTGIIGPNGAGKSTLVNIVTGFLMPSSGSVTFEGQDITYLPPYKILRLGICRTFQNLRLFMNLTVRENIAVGVPDLNDKLLRNVFGWRSMKKHVKKREKEVDSLVCHLALDHVAQQRVGNLSYGEQKLVSIARILATGAPMLFLDEPFSGLDQSQSENLQKMLQNMMGDGITICLIEHNLGLVIRNCQDIVVLDGGRVLAKGSPEEVTGDSTVQEVYVGSKSFAI